MNRSSCETEKDSTMLAQEQEKTVEPVPENNQMNDINEDVDKKESVCPMDNSTHQINGEPINFADDISLDELDRQKCILDTNVLFCPNEAVSSANEHNVGTEEANKDTEEDAKIEDKENMEQETGETNNWYENKLAEKKGIIRERLSKLARLLEFCYPCYTKWLNKMEDIHGSPVCKLESVNHYKLKNSYPNRWKFICRRNTVSENNADIGNITEENSEGVWKLEPCDAWGVHINKESELPPFILRVVKVFEEFLQTTEKSNSTDPQQAEIDSSDNVCLESDPSNENKFKDSQKWQWLLVRCNSMNELMLFVIGKGISCETMDQLKDVYESGAGKDCNVKSLYCKTTNCENSNGARTVLLSGSKTLEETVGGIKMQLAPNTNFWLNAAGAEDVAKTVADLLTLTPKTVVLEIGCGIGLIGLTLASRCQQFVGVDLPAEVAEAETTCKLNNIENTTFISGLPDKVIDKILPILQDQETQAIINGNTSIGRDTEIMTQLRRIPSLDRIAMVTTLTKQSVRAILELARPTEPETGNPFLPVHACVVDTLPSRSHAEVVILMDRMQLDDLNGPCLPKTEDIPETSGEQNPATAKEPEKEETNSTRGKSRWTQAPKPKAATTRKPGFKKNQDNPWKEKFRSLYKRPGSLEKTGYTPQAKIMKKTEKFAGKVWKPAAVARSKKKPFPTETPRPRPETQPEARTAEDFKYIDLREKLAINRINTNITKKIKEHQVLLDIAQEKLSGSGPAIDIMTAKQLQNMLNTVLEQTNKLQTEVARSIGNRIPASTEGRYVEEVKTVRITTTNEKFINEMKPAPGQVYTKCNPVQGLEAGVVRAVPPPEYGKRVEGDPGFKQELPPQEKQQTVPQEQKNPESMFWSRQRPEQSRRWTEPGMSFPKPLPCGDQSSKMLPSPQVGSMIGGMKLGQPIGVGRMQGCVPPVPSVGRSMPSPGSGMASSPGRTLPPGPGRTLPAPGGGMSSPGRREMMLQKPPPGSGKMLGSAGGFPGGLKNSPEPKFPMDRSWSSRQSIRPTESPCFPQGTYPTQKFTPGIWEASPSRVNNPPAPATWQSSGKTFKSVWRNDKPSPPLPAARGSIFNNNEYHSSISQNKFTPKGPLQNGPSLNWATKRPFPVQPTPKDVWARKPEPRNPASYFQRSAMNNLNARGNGRLDD